MESDSKWRIPAPVSGWTGLLAFYSRLGYGLRAVDVGFY